MGGVGVHGFPWVFDATIAMGFHIDIHGFPWVANDIHGMETRGGITRVHTLSSIINVNNLPRHQTTTSSTRAAPPQEARAVRVHIGPHRPPFSLLLPLNNNIHAYAGVNDCFTHL
jgi:hypothetical protein